MPESVDVEEDMGFIDRDFKEGDETNPDVIKWIKLNQQGEVDITIPKVEVIGKPMEDYIRAKHTQEECIGFIDGWNTAKEKLYTEKEVEELLRNYSYDTQTQCRCAVLNWIKWFDKHKK